MKRKAVSAIPRQSVKLCSTHNDRGVLVRVLLLPGKWRTEIFPKIILEWL
jgi:hypothetical protein